MGWKTLRYERVSILFFVSCPKQGLHMYKVGFLECFWPKQGQNLGSASLPTHGSSTPPYPPPSPTPGNQTSMSHQDVTARSHITSCSKQLPWQFKYNTCAIIWKALPRRSKKSSLAFTTFSACTRHTMFWAFGALLVSKLVFEKAHCTHFEEK